MIKIIIFFYSWFHLYGYCLLRILTPVPSFLHSSRHPFPSLSSCQRSPPWECDRSHSLLCCIAFARGHRETAENLCRYSRPFHRVCPQSTVTEKMSSRSAFGYAGCGPAVTHPSTVPTPSCVTCVMAWCRTPITHRTLSVIKIIFIFFNEFVSKMHHRKVQ